MTYKEFLPPPALSNVLECVWTRLPDAMRSDRAGSVLRSAEPVVHNVLPDGAMDIIATFLPDGDISEAFVVGSMTQPQLATLDNHPLVGVRFLPGVGGSALGANATTLTDEQVNISEIFKHTDGIRDAFRALRLDSANAHAIHLFAQSIGMERRTVPALVREAAKQLARPTTALRIEHVARNLRVTRQHLTRVFSAHSGLTPKLFAQICRVRAVLAVAQAQHAQPSDEKSFRRNDFSQHRSTRGPIDTWSTLAAEFGYVDQSHLIAEVHSIIGQTPAGWQASAGSNIPIVPVPVGSL